MQAIWAQRGGCVRGHGLLELDICEAYGFLEVGVFGICHGALNLLVATTRHGAYDLLVAARSRDSRLAHHGACDLVVAAIHHEGFATWLSSIANQLSCL